MSEVTREALALAALVLRRRKYGDARVRLVTRLEHLARRCQVTALDLAKQSPAHRVAVMALAEGDIESPEFWRAVSRGLVQACRQFQNGI